MYTYDQIADYLRDGYWRQQSFNTGNKGPQATGGVLHYNIDKLTPDGQWLAKEALVIYGAVLDVKFVRSHSTDKNEVEIFFDDKEYGAFTSIEGRGGSIDYSSVNIGLDWLDQFGTGYNTYSFQTYIHEIGHALGLGHAGAYNEEGHFVTTRNNIYYGDNSNHYLNDSWQASIMSYFDQDQNPTVHASFAWVHSPMIADWIALDELYGLREAFAGDTVWGFNTTITETVFAHLIELDRPAAFTIVDGSGNDTIDLSGFAIRQVVNLGEESASDVGGIIGNMLIARGTVIENAIGGSGFDVLTGNEVANLLSGGASGDDLYGKAGSDVLRGGSGADRMHGGIGSDRLYGNTANDRLFGDSGSDHLSGDGGNDLLDGGGGMDVLIGGGGRDLLIGGGGADSFVYRSVVDSPAGASCDLLQTGSGGAAFDGAGDAAGDRFDFTGLGDLTWHGTGVGGFTMRNVDNVTYCVVDLDGDQIADFEVAIADGAVRAAAYSAADFMFV